MYTLNAVINVYLFTNGNRSTFSFYFSLLLSLLLLTYCAHAVRAHQEKIAVAFTRTHTSSYMCVDLMSFSGLEGGRLTSESWALYRDMLHWRSWAARSQSFLYTSCTTTSVRHRTTNRLLLIVSLCSELWNDESVTQRFTKQKKWRSRIEMIESEWKRSHVVFLQLVDGEFGLHQVVVQSDDLSAQRSFLVVMVLGLMTPQRDETSPSANCLHMWSVLPHRRRFLFYFEIISFLLLLFQRDSRLTHKYCTFLCQGF